MQKQSQIVWLKPMVPIYQETRKRSKRKKVSRCHIVIHSAVSVSLIFYRGIMLILVFECVFALFQTLAACVKFGI